MEVARRLKEVLGAPDEVTEVLKALISSGGGVPRLLDASTSNVVKEVGVEVLKDKYVLLLITGPKICWRNLYKMKTIYDGIARNGLLEMVWLPSVKLEEEEKEKEEEEEEKGEGEKEEEEEKEKQEFRAFWSRIADNKLRRLRCQMLDDELIKLRSQMPRCVLQYFSPVKGINEIIEACGLMSGEILLVIDPRGDVLSQYRCLPDLWPILPAEKMDRWKRIKEHLQAPGEIMVVLRALISVGNDVLCLSDASTDEMGRPANKRVSIDILRDKCVLLFISGLNIDSSVIRKLSSIYSGIVTKDLVKLVWIPIVEKWNNELEKDFERLQSELRQCILLQPLEDVPIVLKMKPSYIEQDVSEAEGLKFIKEWGLQDVPLVLLLNPQGDVLSNHALQLPQIDKEPRGTPDMKEYTLYWGSKYAYWRERLFREVKAMVQDPILKKAEISISLSPVERDGETEGVSGSFNWKVQRLFHPFKKENKWALLVSKSFTEICAGPLILNVLEAFSIWKVNITEQRPFEYCFKDYYDELSRAFEARLDDEKESADTLDNEIKISDFFDEEMEFEDSLDNETKSEDFLDNENGEKMEAARRMKEVLGGQDKVTEVLKTLISSRGDVPCLIDASMEEMKQVSIDVLKDKYVLLLVSRGSKHLEKGVDFAKGIVKNDLLEIVWLPIVLWTDEAEDEVMKWVSKMPWYVVQYFSPIAGIEFIEQEWGLEDYPTLVMMNPQGDVLGKYVTTESIEIFPIMPGEKMEKARRVKELFQAPDEITTVLKALISSDGDMPLLKECSTGEMVSIDVLKEKFVLLFISCPNILGGQFYEDPESYEILSSIYDGILKDLVKLVWIPIVKRWTDKWRMRFEKLRSEMPYYVVQCVSPVAGLKFIQEEWRLGNCPLLVLMSPQGNVLSKHEMEELPPATETNGGTYEIQDYILYWRARDKKWGEEFAKLAEKVACDPIITRKNISIECHRFESSTRNGLLRTSFNCKKSGDWAALITGQHGPIICEGPQILHVLRDFETWKDDLRLNPFIYCFRKRFEKLAVNIPTSWQR